MSDSLKDLYCNRLHETEGQKLKILCYNYTSFFMFAEVEKPWNYIEKAAKESTQLTKLSYPDVNRRFQQLFLP